MNKRVKIYTIIWAILLAVFNVTCFVTPSGAAGMSKFGGAFWVGYVFITLAFIGQLVCACFALKTDDNTKLFYNIPLIRISYTGLVLTLIFGALCMAIPDLSDWVGVIVCLLIFVFTTIAVTLASVAAGAVEQVDRRVRNRTAFIKEITADAEDLMRCADGNELKEICRKVTDALRYSDPMSNAALVDTEEQIESSFRAFSEAVASDDAELAGAQAEDLLALIGSRNRKCKLLK